MPCDTMRRRRGQTEAERLSDIQRAVQRLETALQSGQVKVVVDRMSGAVAFSGWQEQSRDGVGDVCAYRKLSAKGSFALRKALATAEALAGRKVNQQAIAAGTHSHDGGQTWGGH
jgi:hypothetical protein